MSEKYTNNSTLGGGACFSNKYLATGDEGEPSCEPDKTNPCDVVTGRKTQQETDYNDGWLSFVRYYDSGSADPGTAIGVRWRHSFEARMDSLTLLDGSEYTVSPHPLPPLPPLRSDDYDSRDEACTLGWQGIKNEHRGGTLASATAIMVNGVCELSEGGARVAVLSIRRNVGYPGPSNEPGGWGSVDSPVHTVTTADGSYYTFEQTSPGIYIEASGYPVRLELDGTEWLFYNQDNTVDRFSDGKLLSRTFIDDRELTLGYDAVSGRLTSITDDSGRSLQLTYNSNGQVNTLTHPDDQIIYGYDANYNLTSVTYEDSNVRQYHYDEEMNFPHHLTGITDERGIRFATWAYDANGKAISSSHAGGADRTTLTYNGTSTTVTDAAGGMRTYNLGTAGSRSVVTSVSGDKCIDCPGNFMKVRTYDTNGYLDEATDWEGNVTDYDYDSRGLEVQRIEAKTTSEQRTITTQWHPTFRLPTKITEPDRVIDFTYDASGRVRTRKVTPPRP